MLFRRAAVLLSGLCACAIVPPPPPAPPRQTHLGLEMAQLELSNGLRVEVVRDPLATDVHVTMRYRVGAADDPPDHLGMAHLVEHLMFQQILGAQTIFSRLEDIASSFNADTSHDATTYFEVADASHLEELLSIEAVRIGLRCTSITPSAFEREREVVVNELRQRGGSQSLFTAIHEGVYPAAHPYRNQIGGSEDSVRAITRDQACAFADRFYAPQNAVLVVSGNVTPAAVSTALGKFMAHVAKRAVAEPAPLPPLDSQPRHLEIETQYDRDALVVAWPLPADPLAQIELRAIVGTLGGVIESEIKGRVLVILPGDVRAPMIGFVAIPGEDETIEQVTTGIKRGLELVPSGLSNLGRHDLGKIVFDEIQQAAIYRLFSELEDGDERDTHLATFALAGREPSAALASEFKGLRELTPTGAAGLVREHLGFDAANVVLLHGTHTKSGHHVELPTAVHDLGRRRDPPDPAAAHQPLASTPRPDRGVTRKLANGLTVVLVPSTTVPTVDIRLVFAAGTADEPPDKRGVALIAADGLTWDFRYVNDYLAFAAAGGTGQDDAGIDRTVFEARGLDMHVDYLLAGLRRWVREGQYTASSVVQARRREAKSRGDDDPLTGAWRLALYGGGHPYVAAGLAVGSSDTRSAADATRFRAEHYTPDNATLVIAGHFDPEVATRWVDYLFADWKGSATASSAPPTAPQPASLARELDTEQVTLHIAIPAHGGTRATRLVAAAMLSDLAGDVRHQLGASYGLHVDLVETHLASYYSIVGGVDAPRARDAAELLRTRIAALHTDADAAARAFVIARARVVTDLAAPRGRAAALAAAIEHDVAMRRAPLFDAKTTAEVEALTIDQMTDTLGELDLAGAAVAMGGPKAHVDAAYAALGRTPTYVAAKPAEHLEVPDAPAEAEPSTDNVEDALTEQHSHRPNTLALAADVGYLTETIADHGGGGISVAAEAGLHFDAWATVGLHVGTGYLSGSDNMGVLYPDIPFTVVPVELLAFASGTVYERFWGKAMIGIHADHFSSTETSWHTGLGLDLMLGVDLVDLAKFRLGPYAGTGAVIGSDANTSFLTIGLAIRN